MSLYIQYGIAKRAALPLSCTVLKYMSGFIKSKMIDLQEDTFDDFTTHLIQKQSLKWEKIQAQYAQITQQSLSTKQDIDYSKPEVHCKLNEIEQHLKSAIQDENVHRITNLIDICSKQEYIPRKLLLLSALPICSEKGKYETVCKIKILCDTHYQEVVHQNADFKHYLAEALWVQGNICKSLDLFKTAYENNRFLRRKIVNILKSLILSTSLNQSEAVMYKTLKFCEHISENFADSYLLGVVWQMCFLSEWYADQCTAFEILEKNEKLCASIVNRFPLVVGHALDNHQTEVVYKLLEFLLKKDCKQEYSNVLQCLFDYKSKLVATM